MPGPSSSKKMRNTQCNISASIRIEAGAAIAVGTLSAALVQSQEQQERFPHARLRQPSGSTQEPLSVPVMRKISQRNMSASVGIDAEALVTAGDELQESHEHLRLHPMND